MLLVKDILLFICLRRDLDFFFLVSVSPSADESGTDWTEEAVLTTSETSEVELEQEADLWWLMIGRLALTRVRRNISKLTGVVADRQEILAPEYLVKVLLCTKARLLSLILSLAKSELRSVGVSPRT